VGRCASLQSGPTRRNHGGPESDSQNGPENPIWGAPRIHGELLKLGIDIGETSVGKYMIRRRNPPSQTWRTFLENHLQSLVLAHDRRRILHFGVTAHPRAEWTAQLAATKRLSATGTKEACGCADAMASLTIGSLLRCQQMYNRRFAERRTMEDSRGANAHSIRVCPLYRPGKCGAQRYRREEQSAWAVLRPWRHASDRALCLA
jgi:hypothetical protein